MSQDWSRRRFLQMSCIPSTLAVAGCGQVVPGDTKTETPLPVETDSSGKPVTYGIRVKDESEQTWDFVDVGVEIAFEGTEIWRKKVPGSAIEGSYKTYSDVIQKKIEDGEPVEYLITATPVKTSDSGNRAEWADGKHWVTPGAESAPQVANIDIRMVEHPQRKGVMVEWGPE